MPRSLDSVTACDYKSFRILRNQNQKNELGTMYILMRNLFVPDSTTWLRLSWYEHPWCLLMVRSEQAAAEPRRRASPRVLRATAMCFWWSLATASRAGPRSGHRREEEGCGHPVAGRETSFVSRRHPPHRAHALASTPRAVQVWETFT